MVMGGFFVNSDNIPGYLKWIEYISMFKWGFQASAIVNFLKYYYFFYIYLYRMNSQILILLIVDV